MFGMSGGFRRLGRPNLPSREVTREEFVRLMIADGKSESEAKAQAAFCVSLRSEVQIGNEVLYVKRKEKR